MVDNLALALDERQVYLGSSCLGAPHYSLRDAWVLASLLLADHRLGSEHRFADGAAGHLVE